MDFNPLVSVIIPVYNVEKYLEDCILSLVKQTMKEIEFIFVDDASTDSSPLILDTYKTKYPEVIKVIHCNENKRQGGARNVGIKMASAEYVGFVDSDDMISPDMYQRLYAEIISSGADAAFISATLIPPNQRYDEMFSTNQNNNQSLCYDASTISSFCGITLIDDSRCNYLATQDNGGVWSGLYKKRVIVDNDVWFPERVRFEDNYWVSLLRCYLNSICYVDAIGYYYRYNPNGSSKSRNCDFYDDRTYVEYALLREVKDRQLFSKYYAAWEYLFVNRYGVNTCLAYITRFDEIPYAKIEKLKCKIEKEFPNWKHNRYFTGGIKEKLRIMIFNVPAKRMKKSLLYRIMRLYYNKKVIM